MVGWARRKSGILPTEPCWDEDPADHEVFKIAQSVSPAIPHELAQEASHDEWKERPNQYEVPRGDLIKAVRDILDRTS